MISFLSCLSHFLARFVHLFHVLCMNVLFQKVSNVEKNVILNTLWIAFWSRFLLEFIFVYSSHLFNTHISTKSNAFLFIHTSHTAFRVSLHQFSYTLNDRSHSCVNVEDGLHRVVNVAISLHVWIALLGFASLNTALSRSISSSC